MGRGNLRKFQLLGRCVKGKGLYPLYRLTDAAAEINRERAGDPALRRAPLGEGDYREILKTTGAFLLDHGRGLSRFLDIVSTRSGE